MRLSLLVLSFSVAACSSNATPKAQTCPTSAQSVSFQADGSCGPGGTITVSTEPGLCAIQAAGALAIGLPSTGHFNGNAVTTQYDLSRGNWTLYKGSPDPGGDPSSVTCDAAGGDAGTVLLTCDLNDCVPSNEEGYQCDESTCVMHLTPM